MVMKCPACGAENPDHADFCNLCLSSVGFESPEYCAPPAFDEGYHTSYPSSFSDDAPVPSPDEFTRLPDARPVDIGDYGRRSGALVTDAPESEDAEPAGPVDVGQYGVRSGHHPAEPGPEEYYYQREHRDAGAKGKRRRGRGRKSR